MSILKGRRSPNLKRTVVTLAAMAATLVACGPVSEPESPSVAVETAEVNRPDNECVASGVYGFVCGPQNAEDLVAVPDTPWIIASGMEQGAAIYLVDSDQETWTDLYPADGAQSEQDMTVYTACPGEPDPENFITHGLNLRPGEDGHSTLYAVSHGGTGKVDWGRASSLWS